MTATPVQNGLSELRELLRLCDPALPVAASRGAGGEDADDQHLRDALRRCTLRRGLADAQRLTPQYRFAILRLVFERG